MITEETIARMKQNLEVKNEFFVLDVIKHLEAQIEKMKSDWAEAKKKGLELLNLKTMRIEQLEAQVEKMKCCGNCKNKKSKPTCFFCVKLSKWELAE